MSETTRARHEKLRGRLTDIAEDWIAEDGLSRIKARPLAAEAGCATGAIYSVFGDLTDLVLAVNARTFGKLGATVSDALAEEPEADPVDRLVTMGRAYLRFAAEHPRAWRTLFDLEMSSDHDVLEWYLAELGRLFALIGAPLREIFSEEEPEFIDLMTRTLFSSVHGIVLLGLEKRLSGVPLPELDRMIELLLRNMTSKQTII